MCIRDRADSFNQDIGDWDVSSGSDLKFMFAYASGFDQDLSSWTPSENASLTSMFEGADLMQSNQGVGNTPSIYYFYPYVFTNKTTLQTAVDEWIDDQDAAAETYGDINTWDVSEITDFSSLFHDKTTLSLIHI